MRMWRLLVRYLLAAVLCSLRAPACLAAEDTENRPVYLDPVAPIQKRVDDLMAKMTTPEKIAQLAAVYGGSVEPYAKTGVGWTVFPGTASARNKLQKDMIASSRLNLPIAFTEESLHSSVQHGTIFPLPVQQGCSWNTSLVQQIASTIALEASSVGVDVGFTPVLNMFTDPRFGRHSEGFSENPTLSAAYAKAAVLGYQGDNGTGAMTYLDDKHVVSLAKHYAAYGNAAGGQNAAPSSFDMQTLYDIYLKPWQSFGMHGGRGAMASHQTVSHVPCHANPWLVNTVLRDQFGFGNGSIVSDCNDIGALYWYHISANASQSAAKALQGGVDIDLMCGGNPDMHSYDKLNESLSDGLITIQDIDTAVGHILAGKFAMRLFDEPLVNESTPSILNTEEHQHLAYTAALQGITVAKRPTGKWPPISATTAGVKIAVIGPNGGCKVQAETAFKDPVDGMAGSHQGSSPISSPNRLSKPDLCDAQTNMIGPYVQYGTGVEIETVYEYLTKESGSATVDFARGCEIDNDDMSELPGALKIAAEADFIVLVVGDSLHSCGEWSDRDSLDLPGGQLELITNVKNVSKSTAELVMVLTNGRPTTFGHKNQILDMVDYVLIAWRSGQMGAAAIGDSLLGHAEPTGRLAQGWPRNVGQVNGAASPWLQQVRGKWISNSRGRVVDPDGRRYDDYEGSESVPLFPFGYGLSLSEFTFANLKVEKTNVEEAPLSVSVDVTNVGSVGATEVVQFYIQDPVLPWVPYWKRLIAFDKIFLKKGETQTVKQDVKFIDLALHDQQLKQQVMPGEYTVRVGNSSTTDTLTAKITF